MPEIATGWVTLVPSLKDFGKKLSKDLGGEIDKAGGEATEASKSFGKRLSGGIGDGAKEAVGSFFTEEIGARVGEFIHGSIEAASDLNETLNKTRTVFGDASDAVVKFSSGAATKLGQTQQQALDAAGTFGIFGKAAGLSGKDLSDFSTKFVSLSSDLASFHNTSPEEAIEAIGSALRGEAEPIRKYGVLLDDASLRQEALRQGLVKTTTQALTPQQKTLAAASLIFQKTKNAQGDFTKTSGELANSQRIVSATVQELQTKLGVVLLPVMLTVTKAFASFLGGMENGTGVGGAFVTVIGNMAKPLIDVSKFVMDNWKAITIFGVALGVLTGLMTLHSTILAVQAAGGMKAYLLQTKIATTVSKAFAAVQWLVNAALSANPIVLVIAGLAALAVGLVVAYKKSETFRGIVDGAFGLLKDLGHFIIGSLVSAFSSAVSALQKVAGWFSSAGGSVADADAKVRNFKQTIVDKIGAAIQWLDGLRAKVLGIFDDAGHWLIDTGKNIIGGLIEGIKSMASSLVSTITSYVIDKIPGPIKKALGIASPSKVTREIGRNIVDGLVLGMREKSKDLDKQVQKQVDNLKQRLSSLKSDKDSLSSSVAGAFTQDLFGGSLADLISTGQSSVDSLGHAQEAFNALIGRVADKGFVSQLFQSGNMPLAVELANADDATLQQAEALFQKQNNLAQQLGEDVGKNQFGDKIDGVKQAIEDLRKDNQSNADRTATALAAALDKFGSDVVRRRRKKK